MNIQPQYTPEWEEQNTWRSLPSVEEVPIEARHIWELFLIHRNIVLCRHFIFDADYLTNVNGFFHSIFFGRHYRVGGALTKRWSYTGPLFRFPSSNLLMKHLRADPQYASVLTDTDEFDTIFFISGTSPTPDEGRDPTITAFERLCDTSDISGLNRYALRSRMANHVGSESTAFLIALNAADYHRRGTRPGFFHRDRFETGGDFYLDAALQLEPDPEDPSLSETVSEWVIHGPELWFTDWYSELGDQATLPIPVYRSLLRILLGQDLPDDSQAYRIEFLGITVVTATEAHREQERECPICREEFQVGEELDVLPCGHFFHGLSCLGQWLSSDSQTATCPSCRRPIERAANSDSSSEGEIIGVTLITDFDSVPEGDW